MAIGERTARHRSCPYCSGNRVLVGFNDLATVNPKLAKEWHSTLNHELTSQMVTAGSKKRVWWRCEKGHEWEATIKSRHSGSGCPICTHRSIVPGESDLATTHPVLAQQWHPTQNKDLTPQHVFAGSLRKVWWICEKGHEWRAAISSRSSGVGCPVCAGKVIIAGENDLASQFPEIAAQWHPTKNGKSTPDSVAAHSNRRAWWICEKGHEYSMIINHRTSKLCSCPYCCGKKVLVGFNDLATVNPQLAKEWHPTLNGALTPEMVTAGSAKKVWWTCSLGHIWKTWIYQRGGKRKYGCPVCGGRFSESRLLRYQKLINKQE